MTWPKHDERVRPGGGGILWDRYDAIVGSVWEARLEGKYPGNIEPNKRTGQESVSPHQRGEAMKPGDEYFDAELGVVVHVVEQTDTSAQREALRLRAYSAAGKSERFIARVPARVRPTTIARLRLFADDPFYGFPLLDEVVDEAIHDYLVMMGY